VKPHLEAQQAIVRMLFDPVFAASVRRDPDAALPSLPPPLRAQLAAVDARALAHDRLIGRRLLRTLFDEYKASTTLYLARSKQLASLDAFFASPYFTTVLKHGSPVAYAYPGFLMSGGDEAIAAAAAIELGLAIARRRVTVERDGQVQAAPGVRAIATTQGGLAAVQQAERYLFEVGLMPAVALCDDAPPLALDAAARDATPLYLVTVPTETGHSLVTIDRATYDLVVSLPAPMHPSLQPLLDDELAVAT
jgi:hypothetical protein